MTQKELYKAFVIATLGPEGTCSEYASLAYLEKTGRGGKVDLYPTFEAAVSALKGGRSDSVIIPSAYTQLANIIFGERNSIEIVDVFMLATPSLVIASRWDTTEFKKVATHSSPSGLARGFFPNAELVSTTSNSEAARLLLSLQVDACMTTEICAKEHSLKILCDFGKIAMGWNVFQRRLGHRIAVSDLVTVPGPASH